MPRRRGARSQRRGRGPGRGRGRAPGRGRGQRREAALAAGGLALLVAVSSWSRIWPYLLAALALGAGGALGWWAWRAHRARRAAARRAREEDRLLAARRTLAEVDGLSGLDFERLVAALCRRDGCTRVRRVGGSGDDGADVVGVLPDGRSMVVQCKRFAPRRPIGSREMRGLLGSRVHFAADVALFVTTTRFTAPAERFAATHGIVAIHRDHLAAWRNGSPLPAVIAVSGAGQGDRAHARRWRRTYGRRGRA